jgi:hypothetical protein
MLDGATVPDDLLSMYAFGRFCGEPDGNFAVDTVKKRSSTTWSVFFSALPTRLARSERIFYICLRRKGNLTG